MPFSTPQDASPRFVALQISRAAETVYGKSIPPEEIQARYLGGESAEKPAAVNLRADYPGLRAPRRILFVPTLMTAAFLAWMILTVALLRSFRAGIPEGVRKGVFIGLAAFVLAVHIGFVAAAVSRFMRPDIVSALWRTAVYRATLALPGGALSVWLLCSLAFAAFYRRAERSFEKIELPTPRTATAE